MKHPTPDALSHRAAALARARDAYQSRRLELAADAPALLRGLRERLGISLRELARRSGVSPTYLCRVERGQSDPPGPDFWVKVAAVGGEGSGHA